MTSAHDIPERPDSESVRWDSRQVAAFEAAYRECYSRLVAMCRRLLCHRGDPEAVAQEAFVRAWCSFDRHSGVEPLWPWLATIARRLCIDHRRRLRSEGANRHAGIKTAADRFVAPDEIAETHDDYRLAREALHRLKPTEQRVLTLREVNGWSYAEIARFEGVTVESVHGSLKRARAALRRSYARLTEGAPVGLALRFIRGMRTAVHSSPAASWLALSDGVMAMVMALAVTGAAAATPAAVSSTALIAAVGGQPHVEATRASAAPTAEAPSTSTSSSTAVIRSAGPGAAGRPEPGNDTQLAVAGLPLELPHQGDDTPEEATITAFYASPSYEQDGTLFARGQRYAWCAYPSCGLLFKSVDRGRTWTRLPGKGLLDGELLLPPSYPADDRLFVAGEKVLQVSRDGGETFELAAPIGGPAAMSPRFSTGDPSILLGTGPGWEYRDDVHAVRPASVLVPTSSAVMHVAYASTPTSGTVLVAGGLSGVGVRVGTVFVCEGRVCNTTAIPQLGLPRVAVSPGFVDDGLVVAWQGFDLAVSRDRGKSFVALRVPLPGVIRAVGTAPDGALYVATTWLAAEGPVGGLVVSRDGGATWTVLGRGTALEQGVQSVIALPDGRLLAGLAGPSYYAPGGFMCSLDGGATWAPRCPEG